MGLESVPFMTKKYVSKPSLIIANTGHDSKPTSRIFSLDFVVVNVYTPLTFQNLDHKRTEY